MTRERYVVDSVADFGAGESRLVHVGGREIAVFRVGDEYFAVRNRCAHHGAPLACVGVTGTMLPSRPHEYEYGLEGQVIRCPWHGYEFNLRDGRALADERLRIRTFEVRVEGDDVVVYVERSTRRARPSGRRQTG